MNAEVRSRGTRRSPFNLHRRWCPVPGRCTLVTGRLHRLLRTSDGRESQSRHHLPVWYVCRDRTEWLTGNSKRRIPCRTQLPCPRLTAWCSQDAMTTTCTRSQRRPRETNPDHTHTPTQPLTTTRKGAAGTPMSMNERGVGSDRARGESNGNHGWFLIPMRPPHAASGCTRRWCNTGQCVVPRRTTHKAPPQPV